MEFTKDLMLKIISLDINKPELFEEYNAEIELIRSYITDQDRWTLSRTIVFRCNNKYYESYYTVGSTEYQDESPWEYDDSVEVWEVEPIEVTTVEFRKVIK